MSQGHGREDLAPFILTGAWIFRVSRIILVRDIIKASTSLSPSEDWSLKVEDRTALNAFQSTR